MIDLLVPLISWTSAWILTILGGGCTTKWYKSKTLWSNLIAAGSLFASSQFGYTITESEVALIFLAINSVMRSITGGSLEA